MLGPEKQIWNQIEKAKSVLLVFSAESGGDESAAALALFLAIKKLGGVVDLVNSEGKDGLTNISFLPGAENIEAEIKNLRKFIVSLDISQAKINQIRYTIDENRLNFIISPSSGWFKQEDISTKAGDFKYDLIIAIGSKDLESLGRLYDDNVEFFFKAPLINIDNDPANEVYGQINLLDINSLTLSEIIFRLLEEKGLEIDSDIATCLLAGIIHETKNFKNNRLTPDTLLASSKLISLKARREEIIDRFYRSRDVSLLKLWGRILNNLQSEENDQFIWSAIGRQASADLGQASIRSLEEIIEDLIGNIPESKMVAIFYEYENETSVVLWSTKNIDAQEVLKEWSAWGSKHLAKAVIKNSLDAVKPAIISQIKSTLEKLS